MKIWRNGFFLLFLLFYGTLVYGQPSHIFEVSLKSYLLQYEEDLGGVKESEEGFMFPGAHVSYTFLGNDNNLFFGRALAEVNDSETSYENLLGQRGKTKNTSALLEINLGLGLTSTKLPPSTGFPFEGIQSSFAYIGLGYRQWKREIGNTQSFQGYTAKYNWFYLPVGLRSYYHIGKGFYGTADLSFALIFAKQMDLKLSERSASNFVDAKPKEDGLGFNARVELGLNYEIFPHFFVTFALQYKFRFLSKSKTFTFSQFGNQTTYPESEAHEMGFRLGLKLSF